MINLVTLFTAMCLSVGVLDCDDIEIKESKALWKVSNTLARVTLYVSGKSTITFSTKASKLNEQSQKALIAHELAHLVLFSRKDYTHGHNREHYQLCRKIAFENKVSKNKSKSLCK